MLSDRTQIPVLQEWIGARNEAATAYGRAEIWLHNQAAGSDSPFNSNWIPWQNESTGTNRAWKPEREESGDKESKSTSRNWDGELVLAAKISTLRLSRKTSTGETRAHNSGGRETRQAGKAQELITKDEIWLKNQGRRCLSESKKRSTAPGARHASWRLRFGFVSRNEKKSTEKTNCSGANEELENREVKHREPAEKTRSSNQKSQIDRFGTLHSMKITMKIGTGCYTARNVLLVRTEKNSPENQRYPKKKKPAEGIQPVTCTRDGEVKTQSNPD
jgi:hypothetical protein